MLTAAECLSKENDITIFWDDEAIIDKAETKFGLNLKKVKVAKNIFFSSTLQLKRITTAATYDAIFFLSDGSIPFLPGTKVFVHIQAPLHKKNIKYQSKIKLKFVKQLIVNSYYTKKYIDEAFHRHSIVIYPPVDVRRFGTPAKKDNSILTVGRYSPLPKGDFKKHTEMIAAFKNIVDSGIKGWKLQMVISTLPEHENKVEDLIQSVKKYPIEIHTTASQDEVTNLYRKAKIYWHAAGLDENLEENPDRAEHFGIAVVEAMAAGAVPVVYSAGGLREIVEDKDAGFLFNNTTELIDITKKLMKNDDERKKFKTQARKEAQYYAEDRFCHDITSAFK